VLPAQSVTKSPPKPDQIKTVAVATPPPKVEETKAPRIPKVVEDHLKSFMEYYQSLPSKGKSFATEQAISNLDGQIRLQCLALAVLLNHRASVEPHSTTPEKKKSKK
jgi:hypothetical protein